MQLLGTFAFGAMAVVNLLMFILVMASIFRRTRSHR